jgi:gas vesicle protein
MFRRRRSMQTKPTQLLASLLAAAGLLAGAADASAQGKGKDDSANGNSQGKGKPTLDQRPTVIPREEPTDPTQKGKPATPGRPDKAQTPADVQTLVKDFQAAREKFLEDQKALARQYQQASEEERKAIRERMKDQLDRLKEQQKALQQDMRDRAKELKQRLHPDLNRLIDNGSTEGGRGR